jgi:hypothetical protein
MFKRTLVVRIRTRYEMAFKTMHQGMLDTSYVVQKHVKFGEEWQDIWFHGIASRYHSQARKSQHQHKFHVFPTTI